MDAGDDVDVELLIKPPKLEGTFLLYFCCNVHTIFMKVKFADTFEMIHLDVTFRWHFSKIVPKMTH